MRIAVPVLLSILLLAGCKLNTDYFGEYRGLNLLKDYDFDDVETDGATPKWKLATSDAFMTWERIGDTTDPNGNLARDQAAATPAVGPDGVSPVYRLEIKNLIPNGDFEDATVTADGQTTLPAFWSMENFSSVPKASTVVFGSAPKPEDLSGSISGRALGWAATDAGDQLRLNLHNAALSLHSDAWSATTYRFHCQLINVKDQKTDIAVFLYTQGGVPLLSIAGGGLLAGGNGTWTIPTIQADESADNASVFPLTNYLVANTNDLSTQANEGQIVAFGRQDGTDAIVLDNVRLVPDNETLGVQAQFARLDSGAAPLLPGTKPGMYVFTVWVRNDPTAGTLNRFEPVDLSVRLKGTVKTGTEFTSDPDLRPEAGWPEWTQLTFKMGFDFVNLNSELGGNPALTITLSPTNGNTGDSDVGSLLVSQPVLTFNP